MAKRAAKQATAAPQEPSTSMAQCSAEEEQAANIGYQRKPASPSKVEAEVRATRRRLDEANRERDDRLTGQPLNIPPVGADREGEGQGDDPDTSEADGSAGAVEPAGLAAISRERLPGERRAHYWERLRKAARAAGLPRGQEPGSAYVWATEQTARAFSPRPPEPEPAAVIVEPEPVKAVEPAEPAAPPAQAAANLGVAGLGDIPADWPTLPANASLQVEISWVSANRLRVRDGNGVDLSRALSPAPSYSALSWLETSILFPSKFADISVKATADQDDEKEHIRRERLAIEEIRSILKEMLEAK